MKEIKNQRLWQIDRRQFLAGSAAAWGAGLLGCKKPEQENLGRLEAVWGVHGIVAGRMHKPRAMSIGPDDRLYLVDFTARVLVYEADGTFARSWQTPESKNGRPTGITFDTLRNEVLVADTHYYRVLVYTPEGEWLEERTLGGVNGSAPGEFGFVTDAVRDSQGVFYVSEYGEHDRIQKFSSEGEFLLQWGTHGTERGQFKRPQNLLIDSDGLLWVCDACNHRLQAFDSEGNLVAHWGTEGSAPGELYYPYDAVLDTDGNFFVCEYGNHRIQKFTPEGKSLGIWGHQGRAPGELWNPWALEIDSRGRLHLLDTGNHRVQRVVI